MNPKGPFVLHSNILPGFNTQVVGSKGVQINSPQKSIRLPPEFFHATLLLAKHCMKYFWDRTLKKRRELNPPSFIAR